MRLAALWTTVFLTIAGSAAAADIWRLFQFEEDGFAIDFPQIPVITNQALIGDSRIRTDEYYVGIGSYTFMVTAVLFPYVSREQIGSDESLLRRLIDIFVANCAIHDERPILIRGAAAREIHAENCEKGPTTTARYYFVDDWLYQIVVVGPKGMVSSRETQHFMESFRLTAKRCIYNSAQHCH